MQFKMNGKMIKFQEIENIDETINERYSKLIDKKVF